MPSVTPKKQKKWFFWSITYKIEIIMISVIEMLELPNFGHMTDFSIEGWGWGGGLFFTLSPTVSSPK